MILSNNFGLAVVCNNEVLQEKGDDSVELHWGSEYKLRFENKHNRRAIVKLWIDGEEQSKGGYVIPANSFVDIERNSYTPLKFKLIHPESNLAQNNGKDALNIEKKNGVVEARFYLEDIRILNYRGGPGVWPDTEDLNYLPIDNGIVRPAVRNEQWEEWHNAKPAPFKYAKHEHQLSCKSAISGVTVGGSKSDKVYTKVDIKTEEVYTTLKAYLKGID